MLFGWTPFGDVAYAAVPDPDAYRQGAIVASLSTSPKYSHNSTQATPRYNAAVRTAPER